MRAAGWVLGAATALLVAGCGGGSLEADDPDGYEACQTYAETAQITGDPIGRVGSAMDAGEKASRADTPEIRKAAQQVGDSWLVDEAAMKAACSDHGVEIP